MGKLPNIKIVEDYTKDQSEISAFNNGKMSIADSTDQVRTFKAEIKESEVSRLSLKPKITNATKKTISICLQDLVAEAVDVTTRDGELVFMFATEDKLNKFIKKRCSEESYTLEKTRELTKKFEIVPDASGKFVFTLLDSAVGEEFWKLFGIFQKTAEGEISVNIIRQCYLSFESKLTAILFLKEFSKFDPQIDYQCIQLSGDKIKPYNKDVLNLSGLDPYFVKKHKRNTLKLDAPANTDGLDLITVQQNQIPITNTGQCQIKDIMESDDIMNLNDGGKYEHRQSPDIKQTDAPEILDSKAGEHVHPTRSDRSEHHRDQDAHHSTDKSNSSDSDSSKITTTTSKSVSEDRTSNQQTELTESEFSRMCLKPSYHSKNNDHKNNIFFCLKDLLLETEVIRRDEEIVFQFRSERNLKCFIKSRCTEESNTLKKIRVLPKQFEISKDCLVFECCVKYSDVTDELWARYKIFKENVGKDLKVKDKKKYNFYFFKFHDKLTSLLFMKKFRQWKPHLESGFIRLLQTKQHKPVTKMAKNHEQEALESDVASDDTVVDNSASVTTMVQEDISEHVSSSKQEEERNEDYGSTDVQSFSSKTAEKGDIRNKRFEITESDVCRMKFKVHENPKHFAFCLEDLASAASEISMRDGELVFSFETEPALQKFIESKCTENSNTLEKIRRLPARFAITVDTYDWFTFSVKESYATQKFWEHYYIFLETAEGKNFLKPFFKCKRYYLKFENKLTGFLFMKQFRYQKPQVDLQCIKLTKESIKTDSNDNRRKDVALDDAVDDKPASLTNIDQENIPEHASSSKQEEDETKDSGSINTEIPSHSTVEKGDDMNCKVEITESDICRMQLRVQVYPKHRIRLILGDLASTASEISLREGELVFTFKTEAALQKFIKSKFTENSESLEKIKQLPKRFAISVDNYDKYAFFVRSSEVTAEFWNLYDIFIKEAEFPHFLLETREGYYLKFEDKLTGFLFMKQFHVWKPLLDQQCIKLLQDSIKTDDNSNTRRDVKS